MGKKLTENKAFNMILSLLIALGLWVYVTSLNTNVGEITVRNIPVTIVGEEVLNSKGLMLDLGADGLTVSSRVSGSRDTLVSMAMDPAQYFTATINVTEINEPGTYELSCTVASVNTLFNLTNSVQIVDRGEHIVRVTVTRLLSAQIPVQAVFEGAVDEANGYRANPAEVTPGSITIQGPEELVSQVSYAQVVITGENLTRTYSGELGFQLFDVRDLRVLRARVFLQLCGIVRLRGVELLVERINIAEHRFLIKAAKSGGLKSPRFSHNSTSFPMVRGMV